LHYHACFYMGLPPVDRMKILHIQSEDTIYNKVIVSLI
jgi:hypothetical protein